MDIPFSLVLQITQHLRPALGAAAPAAAAPGAAAPVAAPGAAAPAAEAPEAAAPAAAAPGAAAPAAAPGAAAPAAAAPEAAAPAAAAPGPCSSRSWTRPLAAPCSLGAAPCSPLAAPCGPLAAPYNPRATLWQPARRPLQPARCSLRLARHPLRPTRRPLQPAHRPLAARSPPLASPGCCPPCCTQPYWPAPSCPSRPAVLLVALLAHPSLRGAPPPPLPPPTLLLLLLTSLVLRMSRLLLLLVGSAVAARARVTRVVAVAARVVVAVAAVAAVEVAEVVAAVGVVAEVGAAVGVAAVGVAVVAAVGVVAVEVELFRGEVLGVAKGSSSSVRATPLRPSSFVSGLFSVGRQGVVFAARMSFAWVTVLVRHAGSLILSTAASLTKMTLGAQILATRLSAPTGQSCLGLDYDAIHAAMYALSVSAEGDCYRCVPPDPGIGAAALGASEFALPGSCAGPGVRVRSGSSPLLVSPPVAPDSSVAPPPWSLPSPAPPCLPCIEGRQRAALHSSFPPTTAPLQTLHMDLWGPARVSGQDCERYFLVVVDEYTRYTMVFPLRSKGQVPDVLIPWIRAVRPQLREWFCEDLPVLRLHSGRGGEFSSELLRDFCCGEGILQSFTLLASPQKNGIAERRIVRCASPQPLAPCLLAGDLAYTALDREGWRCVVFRVWGSRAFVRDTSADKLSAYAIPFDFLGFPPNAPGCSLLPSLPLPHCPSPPPPPLFLAPGPPPVVPLPPQGPAPSGASQVDPLPGTVTVKVAVDSGTARGAASGVAASRGAEPGGAEPEGAEPRGAESEGAESGGDESGGAEPGGTEPAGAEPEGAESEGAESGGAEPRGTASAGGSAGASPQLSPRREPFSPQQLREWFSQCTRLRSGAAGAGGSAAGGTGAGGARATRLGGAGVTAGAGVTRGAGAAGP
ncbi:unnamed protein product [Closterium sp. NIES-54]